ncbi:lachesin [Nasonia vitripennis]|uniref:Ig-like domain-containing protein n=1 Tax=Nasonia vitripennis TaxID=7425 RepID=A0A7M7PZ79_NASVI|nr:lachesin [Nasonia vitripennis]XP_031778996.1 lachesin [Nasonia vitripennis]
MIDRERTFFAVLLALLMYPNDNLGGAFQPEFVKPLQNLTIPLGRDAVFTCHVEHLGGYRVGWVKADTKAIQAIHDHVITHNPRVSVSHGDHSTWSLRIKGAQKEDEGLYMCQINTDPMKSQTGMLSIEVPPDFIPEETSGDVTVPEGWHVKLKCRATGIPPPQISWRREDQKEIIIREPFHDKSTSSNEKIKVHKVTEWIGEELHLTKIKRDQMGVYHCIASNQVPPSISKRIIVDVHFPPVIHVPNQLVGAPLGTDVVLECIVEASPQSINFWLNNQGVMIISSTRHDVQVVTKAPTKGHHSAHPNFNFKVKMLLTIRNFTKQDVGTYRCTAKNSNGDFESSIRLYDITSAVKQKPISSEVSFSESGSEFEHHHHHHHQQQHMDGELVELDNDSLDETAEIEHAEMGNRPLSLDNTVQGHVGSTQFSTPVTGLKPRGGNRRANGHQHSASRTSTSRSCGAATTLLVGTLPLLLYCR